MKGEIVEILLQHVLNLPIFAGAKTYIPPGATGNAISNIMVMEGHDVEHWVSPHEIILTSLITYSDRTAQEFDQLFTKLNDLQCSAVVIKLGRYVGTLPERLIKLSSTLGLPLVVVDSATQYKDIISQVMTLLFNESNRQLRHYLQASQTFINLLNESADVNALLEELGKMTNTTASIVPAIRFSSRPLQPGEPATVTTKNETVRSLPPNEHRSRHYYHHSYALLGKLHEEILTQLEVRDGNNQFLCLKTRGALNDATYLIIETAVTLIGLELNIQVNNQNVKRRQITDAVDLLLSDDNLSSINLPTILEERHLTADQLFCLVTVEMSEGRQYKDFFETHPAERTSLLARFQQAYPKSFYRIWPNQLLVFLPVGRESAQVKSVITKLALQVSQSAGDQCKVRMALSKPEMFVEFKSAAGQNQHILSLSRILFADQTVSVSSQSDLGIYQLLDINHFSMDHIRSIIPPSLLLMHEKEPDLAETLSVYIDNAFNLTKSADALYIHPKTMRYRLNKIHDKYGITTDNATDLTNISVGTRLLHLL